LNRLTGFVGYIDLRAGFDDGDFCGFGFVPIIARIVAIVRRAASSSL
jgi:hypothetical protein